MKTYSGREDGKRRTQVLKKRTYSRTETVIQNPGLGGGREHREGGKLKRSEISLFGNVFRTGDWNLTKPVWTDEVSQPHRRVPKERSGTYSRTETVVQTPALGARTRVRNIVKVEGGKKRTYS